MGRIGHREQHRLTAPPIWTWYREEGILGKRTEALMGGGIHPSFCSSGTLERILANREPPANLGFRQRSFLVCGQARGSYEFRSTAPLIIPKLRFTGFPMIIQDDPTRVAGCEPSGQPADWRHSVGLSSKGQREPRQDQRSRELHWRCWLSQNKRH